MTEKKSSQDQSTKDHVIIIESPLIASEEQNESDQRQSKNKTMFGLCSWIFIIGGAIVTGGVIVLIWYLNKASPPSNGPGDFNSGGAPNAENGKKRNPRNGHYEKAKHYKAEDFIENGIYGWKPWYPSEYPDHNKPWSGDVEVIREKSGATTIAYNNYVIGETKKIGVMVAGNSGKPGGGCNGPARCNNVYAHHKTQEEDIVSNWMITECGWGNQECWNNIFKTTIYQKWGLMYQSGVYTYQKVDYTSRTLKAWQYGDAWVVKDAQLSAKVVPSDIPEDNSYDTSKNFPCDLFFVAGPNAEKASLDSSHKPSSSMRRTFSKKAANNWRFFREGLKAALRGGMESMRQNGIKYAYVASVSTGLYAGKHKQELKKETMVGEDSMTEFEKILTEVCNEIMDDTGEARCAAFEKVIRVTLP